jgi:hypothetical protein
MVAANSLACMYNRPHPPYITPAATAFLGGYHSTKGPALRGWLSRGGVPRDGGRSTVGCG